MKNRKRQKAYKNIFFHLDRWGFSQNRAPLHLFIICGDVDFDDLWLLHKARMFWKYNILVACPGITRDLFRGAATIVWNWSLILKGEDLSGKHFNYPPDDPWYGDSNVSLEPLPISLQIVRSSILASEES